MDFSFISDHEFRESLVRDYEELIACRDRGAWKAVHVLAGSIVEALLIEYLVVSGARPNNRDPLTLALNDAIQACLAAGVIQKSTASLCDVVRDYRNLIHPGRLIRLKQNVSAEGAVIAVSLVSLISREVAEKRKATYGPTAEQIARKIRTDEHALAVLPNLLSEANEHEKTKLVRTVLVDAYLQDEADPFASSEQVLSRLRGAYRQVLDSLPPAIQAQQAAHFAKIVREGSTEEIERYGDAFFVATDIAHLNKQDASIVTKYLTTRLEPATVLTEGLVRTTAELGQFLEHAELGRFANNIVRLLVRQSDSDVDKVLAFASKVFDALDDTKQKELDARGDAWVKLAKEKNYTQKYKDRLDKLNTSWFHVDF